MAKFFYNRQFFERFGTLYSKIIANSNKKCYEYWWFTNHLEDKIPSMDENWKNAFLDSWVKSKKGLWISDVEDDYKDDPEFRKVLVNNLIMFDRKLKLEKLLS